MEGARTQAEGEGRRHTRAALAENPNQRDRSPLTPTQLSVNIREHSPALPSSFLSPAQSPDELCIYQRGKKYSPRTWSPIKELKKNSAFHSTVRTPPKHPPSSISSPQVGVTLRSSPRKRLHLEETERIPLTPDKIDFSDMSTPQKFKIGSPSKKSPPIKRLKIEETVEELKCPVEVALKGLSPTQLIYIIKNITYKHPEIEEEIKKEMPVPDLTPLEEKLNYLKGNIYKSLPTTRLSSKTDSLAFSRVAIHLAAFKKGLLEQGKTLVESQHWESVIKYVFLAWNYVRGIPTWDNQPHNMQRKQCFKALSNFCMTSLKKGSFNKEKLNNIHDKLQGMIADSEEIQSCLKYVQGQFQSFS